MTCGAGIREIEAWFRAAGLERPDRQAAWIVQDVAGLERAAIVARPDRALTESEWRLCRAMASRRLGGEPLQYILGHTNFFGLRLAVTPDVLIPRPETEQLVEHVLRQIKGQPRPRVLDIGTGSGCIALALKHERRDARVWACDVEPGALRVAERNARTLSLGVHFFQGDLAAPGFAAGFAGMLDVIISNPPYVSADERASLPLDVIDHEPHRALFADADPLSYYGAIAREAAVVLRPRGFLGFEVHEERAPDVASVLDAHGFGDLEQLSDFAERPRIVSGRLLP